MRRSLGMDKPSRAISLRAGQGAGQSHGASQPRQRHRFRQDGEVLVEIVETSRVPTRGNGQHVAIEQLEALLQRERAAREQVEQALQQAQAAIRALQTQSAHAEIAHQEAISAERRAREAAEELASEVREKLETAGAAHAVMPSRRGRREPPQHEAAQGELLASAEPEPVQWWVPGWNRPNGLKGS